MPEQLASDVELLRRMGAGDEAAFTELYRRRQGGVYRFAFQMCGSAAVADDVVQETFLTVIGGHARYQESRGSVAAFLYGIARNHVLRAAQRDRKHAGEPDAEHVAAQGDLAREVVRSRMLESVRAAVLMLPVHYREAVVLCDLHEMEYAEAAEALGCAIGTVRSRLHRGRQMLAERLGGNREPAPDGIKPVRCET
ncbi:MAG TPA: RNA polymerase sigma factor [Bryobacteraceae bacterium]|nr:RNA polymerase sigma factor [Bryobacteraceae bacterium]